MANRNRRDDSVISDNTAAIVSRLANRISDVSRSIQQTLAAEIAELRADAQLVDLLGASVEGNVDTVLHALQYEIPIERVEAPTAALEYARRLAQRGVPANALVRAYRLGQQALLATILDEIHQSELHPELALDVYEHMTTVTFRYIDWISQHVVETYEAERDRWLENLNSVRAVRVREVLENRGIDVDAMTNAIRYSLRRTHLALVLWYPDTENTGNELVRLERFLREVTETLDTAGDPLFIATDRISGWGWIPVRADAAPGIVGHIRLFVAGRKDAPAVAVGTPLPGIDGFRRSHHQAQHARTVAIANGSISNTVIAASDPGLFAAALLGANLLEAKTWVQETLGPLAVDTENNALLRETLRVYLRDGCSYKSAAEYLNLHSNTVKYRVRRAIERRGRSIAADRLDVELALLMCQWFEAAVLESDSREFG